MCVLMFLKGFYKLNTLTLFEIHMAKYFFHVCHLSVNFIFLTQRFSFFVKMIDFVKSINYLIFAFHVLLRKVFSNYITIYLCILFIIFNTNRLKTSSQIQNTKYITSTCGSFEVVSISVLWLPKKVLGSWASLIKLRVWNQKSYSPTTLSKESSFRLCLT